LKPDVTLITDALATLVATVEALTEKVGKLGFQLQHMDTLVSNVHSRMGTLENQLAFNKEAILSLAKSYQQHQQKSGDPEVTLTLPLSQIAKLLPDKIDSVSVAFGDGIIDKDTAVLLKNPKDPSVLSAQEKQAALTKFDSGNLNGGKINAIKMMRTRTGLSLKEAKDRIEEWLATQPHSELLATAS